MRYSNLTNSELLSIILGNKIDTVNEAVEQYNSVGEMIHTFTEEDILSIKGFGKSTINKLNALNILYKRMTEEARYKGTNSIMRPKDVYELLKNYYKYEQQEILILLTLDTKNTVTHTIEVFKGSLNTSIVHPREIFNYAVKYSASKIVIVHNHPSGCKDPSKEDINVSIRIKECGEIMGINLLDSIIIAGQEYTSMQDQGII